jgi:hypothetical protein
MSVAVTIDVDGADCYRAIHGLPLGGDDVVWSHALPRFLALCASLDVRATLFVVGRDLERAENARCIAEAARAGHEIASHSHRHDYALSRRPRAAIDDDVARSRQAIVDVTGHAPRGFRAPGYNQSEALLDALEQHGFAYDSSFFPTPLYFAARAAAIGLYRLRRRPTRSLVGDPREFFAARAPFLPMRGARHRAARGPRARALVELPIAVATSFRLPWFGTSLALAPNALGALATRAALRARHPLVLELHALDFADASDGYEPALLAAQADLRVPAPLKSARLRAAVRALQAARPLVTLDELASDARAVLRADGGQ